jgi:hypothetical protein
MPYEWTPPPMEPHLKVLKELPEGMHEYGSNPRQACKEGDIPIISGSRYHFCFMCAGWIEGTPNEYEENSMDVMSGREGTVSYCRRCGTEIGFSGCVS